MTIECLHPVDQAIIEGIVWKFARKGLPLSLDDGEEIVVDRTTDPREIIAAMCTTDEDALIVHYTDDNGAPRRGFVLFVYGNEPGVVAADWTDVPVIDEVCQTIVDINQPKEV